jgi:hypothetical protein
LPSNSTTAIAVYRDATAIAAVALSAQETGVRVRQCPAPSCTIKLPSPPPGDKPNDGDSYRVQDADGSCNPTHEIVIVPPAGTTIRGGGSFALSAAFASALVTFDQAADDWTVDEGGGALLPSLLGSAKNVTLAPSSLLIVGPFPFAAAGVLEAMVLVLDLDATSSATHNASWGTGATSVVQWAWTNKTGDPANTRSLAIRNINGARSYHINWAVLEYPIP